MCWTHVFVGTACSELGAVRRITDAVNHVRVALHIDASVGTRHMQPNTANLVGAIKLEGRSLVEGDNLVLTRCSQAVRAGGLEGHGQGHLERGSSFVKMTHKGTHFVVASDVTIRVALLPIEAAAEPARGKINTTRA